MFLRFPGSCLRLSQGLTFPGGFPAIVLGQFLRQRRFPALQLPGLGAGLGELVLRSGDLLELALQLRQLSLQIGQQPGLVVAAAVEVLLQGVGGLCIRGVLLAGGDEGGDPPFQPRVLGDGQSALPDDGAALKNLRPTPSRASPQFWPVRPGTAYPVPAYTA